MDDLAVCIYERLDDLKVIAGQIGGNHGHLAMARRDDSQPPGYVGELGGAPLSSARSDSIAPQAAGSARKAW